MNTQNIYEKKLEELRNFNLISLLEFNRNEIFSIILGKFLKRYPEKVFVKKLLRKKLIENPEIPQEVLDFFKESEEDSLSHEKIVYKKVIDDDRIYYDSYEDISEDFRNIINLPEIRNILVLLENSVRKLLSTRSLISLPGFKPLKNEYGEVILGFYDDNSKGHNLRECKIRLTFIKDDIDFNFDLGNLVYFVYKK